MSKTKLTVGLAAGGLAIVGAGALGVAMKDATLSKPANADTEHVTSTSTSTAKSETAKATSEAPTTAKASVAAEASEHAVQGQVLAENRERLDAVLEDVSAVVGAREAEVSNALANTADNTSVISAIATTGTQPATAVLEPTVAKPTVVNATAQGAVAPGGVALKPETEAAIAIVSETLDNHSEAHPETSETTQVTDTHSEVATETHSEASTTTASSEAPVETPASETASTEVVASTSEVKTEDHSQASETVAPTSEAPTTVETSEAQAPVITVSEAPTYEAPATTPIEAVQPETYDAPVTETTTTVATETPAPAPTTSNASAETTPNTYPTGQCTWGVKEMAPWVGNYWGNARDWIASAQNAGYSTGSTPTVGSVAVWPEDGGGYGHVAYVMSVTNNNSIQVMESNYAGNMSIGNYRGEFDPTNTYSGSSVSYIYPN